MYFCLSLFISFAWSNVLLDRPETRDQIEWDGAHQKREIKPMKLQRAKLLEQHYLGRLRSFIWERLTYPKMSLAMKEQGEVKIGFRVNSNGDFFEIVQMTSSGHKRLDQAALETLKKLKSFDPPPSEIQNQLSQIELPCKFVIDEN